MSLGKIQISQDLANILYEQLKKKIISRGMFEISKIIHERIPGIIGTGIFFTKKSLQ